MTESERSIEVGVGAVVFRGEEVLLVRRGKAPFEGHWSVPGGRLEVGERVVDGVAREVREETGGEIKIIGLLDVFDAIPDSDQKLPHTVIIDYVAEWRGGAPVAGDDAAAAEFVTMEEALSRVSWDVTRNALARAYEIYVAHRHNEGALDA